MLVSILSFIASITINVGRVVTDGWQQGMTTAAILLVCGVILLTGSMLLRGIRLMMEEAGLRVPEAAAAKESATEVAADQPAAIHRG